jgi:hypothetical protein
MGKRRMVDVEQEDVLHLAISEEPTVRPRVTKVLRGSRRRTLLHFRSGSRASIGYFRRYDCCGNYLPVPLQQVTDHMYGLVLMRPRANNNADVIP